jgi:hypothetical protein
MSTIQVVHTHVSNYPNTGRYFFAELAAGKHSIIVTVAPKYIAVTVQNASNRAWRGPGKNFRDLDTALANYKTAEIRAMLRTAVELSAAAV